MYMVPTDLRTADFDFELPPELIAQEPVPRREESRLLGLDRHSERIEHVHFSDIGHYLCPGDLLVANRSKVIPARVTARKASGGLVELLLLRPLAEEATRSGHMQWRAMARPSRKLKPGMALQIPGSDLTVLPLKALGEGEWTVE